MKTLSIDLRWIDASGVGMYIKGILPNLIAELSAIRINAIGNPDRLAQFPWADAANVRLIDCRAGRYSLAEQIQLPRAIPRGTDLFFSPYYTIPLLYRGPLAVTVHDLSHRVVPEITGNLRKRLYAQIMYRALRRRAAVIFTVSNFTKSELIRLTRGRREDNILPVHLGISTEWYRAAHLAPLRTRPYFVCVGNIKPYKNLPRLVRAFLSIQHQIPHDLVIIGQSEGLITGESAEFFHMVRSAGERIHMTGFVPDTDLLALVGHASALIMPSLYEGFGLPPLEAMAAAVPAVVSRAASLPEICGDAALYFDPLQVEDMAARLLEIATDVQLSRRLSQIGPQHAQLFNWQTCASQTARALHAALHSR